MAGDIRSFILRKSQICNFYIWSEQFLKIFACFKLVVKGDLWPQSRLPSGKSIKAIMLLKCSWGNEMMPNLVLMCAACLITEVITH